MNSIEEARQKLYDDVARTIQERPDLTYADIGKQFGIAQPTVQIIARLKGLKRYKTGEQNNG